MWRPSRHLFGAYRAAAPRWLMIAALALAAALVIGPTETARATHVTPIFVAGNPTCGSLTTGLIELKVEPVAYGTFTDGTLTVMISGVSNNTFNTFDWSSNIGVDVVVVKGGPNANQYNYSPEATSDLDLHSPNNGPTRFYGLSHVSFCYDVEAEASISGEKWWDSILGTQPGVKEASEARVAGWEIHLIGPSGLHSHTNTNSSGAYSFTGLLLPGTYTVCESPPPSGSIPFLKDQVFPTSSTPNAVDCSTHSGAKGIGYQVTLSAGQNRTGLDFGNTI